MATGLARRFPCTRPVPARTSIRRSLCGLTIGLCQQLGRCHSSNGPRLSGRYAAKRSVSNFQAAARLAHSGKLGKRIRFSPRFIPWSLDNTTPLGEPIACARRLRLGYVARPACRWRLTTSIMSTVLARLRFSTPAQNLWIRRAHARSLPMGQPDGRYDANRVRAGSQGIHASTCQWRKARARFSRHSSANGPAGCNRWELVRCVTSATKACRNGRRYGPWFILRRLRRKLRSERERELPLCGPEHRRPRRNFSTTVRRSR